MRFRSLFGFVLLFAVHPAEGVRPLKRQWDWKSRLTKSAKERGIPGLVLQYRDLHGGGKIIFGDFGVRDRSVAMEDALFPIGSVSKVLLALAVLQLRDRGRIDLEDPVTMHLRELKDLPNFGGAGDGVIRLIHLLSHTAGLPRGEVPEPPKTLEALVEGLKAFTPTTRPGAEIVYSNVGMALLSAVVERVTGKPYKTHLKESVLASLGLRDTYADSADAPVSKLVTGHLHKGDTHIPSNGRIRKDLYGNISGAVSTSSDLYRLLSYLLGSRLDGSQTPPGLRDTTVQSSFQPVFPHAKAGSSRKLAYQQGMPWRIEEPIVYHMGDTLTRTVFLGLIPQQVGLTALMNTGSRDDLYWMHDQMFSILEGLREDQRQSSHETER